MAEGNALGAVFSGQPGTSSYSNPGVNALIAGGGTPAADPMGGLKAASGALGVAQQAQQLQSGQITMDQQYYDLHKAKFGSLMDAAKSIQLNPTQDNTTNVVGLMQQSGLIDPATGTQFLTKIAGMGNDPKAIGAYAGNLVSTLNSQEQQLDAAYGKTQTLNNGGQTLTVNSKAPSAAGPGGTQVLSGSAPIANTPSPEFTAAPRTWKTSDGVEHQGTQQQYQAAVGAGQVAGSGTGASGSGGTFANIAAGRMPPAAGTPPAPASTGQGAPAPATPAPSGPSTAAGTFTPTAQTMPPVSDDLFNAARARITGGQSTPADRNIIRGYAIQHNMKLPGNHTGFEPQPGQPPQTAAPAATGAPQPATAAPASPQNAGLAGPAPGLGQAQTVDADASAKQFANITAAATNLPNMKATVATMESVLPQITTGPQAAAWNHVKSGVNFATELATGKDAFDPKAIAAQDEFRNNSVKLAQQQFQALGGTGTDGQLASASGDVPNDSLSNMSNSQLLAMNKGLIDAQQARASAAQAWKTQNGPASYGAFVDDWNKSFSPRAFQFNYLSPADRGTMLHSMSPQEKTQLKTAYDTAVQRGWIAPQTGR